MKPTACIITILCMTILGISCSQEKPAPENVESVENKVTGKDVLDQTKETLGTTKDFLMQKKTDYQIQLETKLRETEDMIQALQQKASEAKTEAKAKYNELIASLGEKQEEAKTKLMELKSASAESWEDIKVGMDAALENLKNAYNKAKLHFQE
ncbi:MAG: hypothetical protein E3K37_07580 [Candidatus Kuenenia sp.]|nr:hypothetical protein [Candidatus Kuenenia hertensis]